MDTRNLRKIAVIAVHGVGEHKPFETARAVGDLLQDLDQARAPLTDTPPADAPPCAVTPSYDPFTERIIRVTVRPVIVSPDAGDERRGIRGPFHELVSRALQVKPPMTASAAGDATLDDELAFAFMRGQLRHYHGEDPADTYETLRLEGRRRADDTDERAVHIYELHWSDLSNLTGGVLRIFAELYQLLFHLPSLGTHAVDAEAMHHRDASWRWFRRMQSWSAIVLTAPIPVLNLFMLGAAAVVTATATLERVAPGRQLVIVVAAVAAAAIAAVGRLFWKYSRPPWILWLAPVGLAVAAVVAAGVEATSLTTTNCNGPFAPTTCAAVLAWLPFSETVIVATPVMLCIVLIVRAYNDRRPGVSRWALGLAAVPIAGLALTRSIPVETPDVFVGGGIRAFEVLYVTLLVAWAAFYLISVAALLAGFFAVSGHTADDPARRCRLTANITLSISAFMFSTITIAAWGVIAAALRTPLVRLHLTYTPFWSVLRTDGTVVGMVDAALRQTSLVLPILAIAGGLSALPAIWGLAPAVWSELFAPDQFATRRRTFATRLGEWLDLTFKGLLTSGIVLYAAIMFAVPAGLLRAWTPDVGSRQNRDSNAWRVERRSVRVAADDAGTSQEARAWIPASARRDARRGQLVSRTPARSKSQGAYLRALRVAVAIHLQLDRRCGRQTVRRRRHRRSQPGHGDHRRLAALRAPRIGRIRGWGLGRSGAPAACVDAGDFVHDGMPTARAVWAAVPSPLSVGAPRRRTDAAPA